MADDRSELLQGTLEMLVLRTLALEPMHGWGIAHRITRMSRDVFLVTQGSLYPALVRMKRRGWVKTTWRTTENKSSAPTWKWRPSIGGSMASPPKMRGARAPSHSAGWSE